MMLVTTIVEGSSVTICGLAIRVIYGTDLEIPELVGNEGYYSREQGAIYVQANLPHSRMRDTLAHELAHAFLDASGLGAFFASRLKADDDYEDFEELTIRLFVPNFLRLIDDNGGSLLHVPAEVSR